MINEIKTIVKNYLDNAKLCAVIVGTVTDDGIKISDKLTLSMEIVVGNLKNSVISGQKVRLLRNHGGHTYYILEVIA